MMNGYKNLIRKLSKSDIAVILESKEIELHNLEGKNFLYKEGVIESLKREIDALNEVYSEELNQTGRRNLS